MTTKDDIQAINRALLEGTLGIGESGLPATGEHAPRAHVCETCGAPDALREPHGTRWLCQECVEEESRPVDRQWSMSGVMPEGATRFQRLMETWRQHYACDPHAALRPLSETTSYAELARCAEIHGISGPAEGDWFPGWQTRDASVGLAEMERRAALRLAQTPEETDSIIREQLGVALRAFVGRVADLHTLVDMRVEIDMNLRRALACATVVEPTNAIEITFTRGRHQPKPELLPHPKYTRLGENPETGGLVPLCLGAVQKEES